MSREYPTTSLKDVLYLSNDPVSIDPLSSYPISGVYSFGRGLFARQSLLGSETTYKIFHRLHKDDFVLSQLKGWEGALARVSNIFEGWFLSPQFQTFRAIPNKIDNNYLEWYLKQSKTWEELKNKSHGMGARRDTVYPNQFLSLTIPLPPIEEQRRIVARIEELAAKIEEARGLQKQIQNDLYVLRRSIFFASTKGKLIPTPMRDLLNLREADVFVNPEETYHFAGIYSFGKGMFKGQHRTGTEFSYTRLTHLKTNNFVYPKLMAWEGALAIVPSECEGLVVSPEFPVFEVNQDKVLPETLEVYFQSPDVWPLLSGASTGTNVRRKRLNPSDFLAFKMPLPSMETQMLLRDVNRQTNMIKQQSQTSAELNALLPSILDKAFKGEL